MHAGYILFVSAIFVSPLLVLISINSLAKHQLLKHTFATAYFRSFLPNFSCPIYYLRQKE